MASEKLRNMIFGIGYEIRDKPIKDANKAVDQYKDSVKNSSKNTKKLSDEAKQAAKELKEIGTRGKKAANQLSSSFRSVGVAIGTYIGIHELKKGFQSTIKLAGDLQEETAKFNTVFGGIGRGADQLADEASVWIEKYADRVGRGRLETMKFLSETQNLFVGFGASRQEAFELSTQIQELGVDLASFSNLADADALNLLQSGLLGNHRAVKSLGIALTESTLKAKAAELGYKQNFDALDPLTKMQIRMAVAIEQSTDAIGDAERTQDSYVNQNKRMKAMFEDTVAEIGQELIPTMTELVKTVNENKAGIVDFVTTGVNVANSAVKGFTKVVGFATKHSKILKPVLAGLLTTFIGFKIVGIVTALYAAFNAATVAATGSTVAAIGPMAAFNAVLTANPIGIVIVAIGALVAAGVAMYENWEQITQWMGNLFDRIKSGIDDIVGYDYEAKVKVAAETKTGPTASHAITGRAGAGVATQRRRGYATGTNSARRGMAWVGENGPELVKFNGGETVYTNSQSTRMESGVIEMNINVEGTNVAQDALEKIRDLVREVIELYFSEMATKGGYKLGTS